MLYRYLWILSRAIKVENAKIQLSTYGENKNMRKLNENKNKSQNQEEGSTQKYELPTNFCLIITSIIYITIAIVITSIIFVVTIIIIIIIFYIIIMLLPRSTWTIEFPSSPAVYHNYITVIAHQSVGTHNHPVINRKKKTEVT